MKAPLIRWSVWATERRCYHELRWNRYSSAAADYGVCVAQEERGWRLDEARIEGDPAAGHEGT
jgi:hypothetical protein